MAQKNTNEMMTYEQFVELERKREELKTRNKVEFAGIVTEIVALPTKEKTTKDGSHILDENQQPTFWDPMFWATIATLGSEEGVLLSAEQYQTVEIGKHFLFAGKLKNRKFKVETVTEI